MSARAPDIMNSSAAVRIAGVAWVITLALAVATVPLIVITREVPIEVFGVRGLDLGMGVVYATVGALVRRRHPRHPIGWLFTLVGFIAVFQSFGTEYANYSIARHDGALPVTAFLAWSQAWLWIPMLAAMGVATMLFPTGRLLGPRWRWGVVLLSVAAVLFSIGIAFLPGPLDEITQGFKNPFALSETVADPLVTGGAILFIVSVGVALASVVTRYRRSRGDEREQLRWLTFAASFGFTGFLIVMSVNLAGKSPVLAKVGGVVVLLGFGGIAIAAGIAIVRYRLYDIEIIINRAVVYSVLAAFITIVYVGIIVGIGALVGTRGGSGVALPIAATAVVAVAFQPVRQRARDLANRFVFGKRTTPYEALAGLSGARSVEELLPRVARFATESTSVRRAIVWLSTGLELRPAARWPEDGLIPSPVPLREGEPPTLPGGEHTYSLIHHGDLLGAITVGKGPAETPSPADHRLLSDLAAHAAVALRGLLDAVPLPSGVVTFLMTDVEGSTRLWEEDPGAMATAIAEHDALVEAIVREHGGVLIKSRGEGDSTFSVFAEAGDAVAAAVAVQRTIARHPWPTPRPLLIRAAAHTGEAELRQRDYYGPVVNRCARLRAIARGGQTVVSTATQELVRDRLPENAGLRDLGAHQLKDLSGAERVYELLVNVPSTPP